MTELHILHAAFRSPVVGGIVLSTRPAWRSKDARKLFEILEKKYEFNLTNEDIRCILYEMNAPVDVIDIICCPICDYSDRQAVEKIREMAL